MTRVGGNTFSHDLLLGVGLLIQDAKLIIAVNEHDACVVALLHSTLILLQGVKEGFRGGVQEGLDRGQTGV